MDGKQKLEELVAGLDGVTPGPWDVVGNCVTDFGREWQGSLSMEFIPNGTGEDGINERHKEDAAHIARCDPDAIRSISDAFKAMERERDELRALIALAHPVMRDCGWHLAIAADPQGDGVLEAACTEIEDKFAEALKDSRHEG